MYCSTWRSTNQNKLEVRNIIPLSSINKKWRRNKAYINISTRAPHNKTERKPFLKWRTVSMLGVRSAVYFALYTIQSRCLNKPATGVRLFVELEHDHESARTWYLFRNNRRTFPKYSRWLYWVYSL